MGRWREGGWGWGGGVWGWGGRSLSRGGGVGHGSPVLPNGLLVFEVLTCEVIVPPHAPEASFPPPGNKCRMLPPP